MKFAVVVFPGSNCDHDVYHALKLVNNGNVEFVWHQQSSLKGFDAVVLPGGFSYGDYLRAGAIARFSPIVKEVVQFANKGKIVLGICNGFQVLTECDLLPGSLMRNSNLRFICKNIYMRTENPHTNFSRKLQLGQVVTLPIAHGEGNYFADDDDLKQLEDNQQIVFRYSSAKGEVKRENNPNGSIDNIAGIINKEGNVLGLMPHPERVVENLLGAEDGRLILESLCA